MALQLAMYYVSSHASARYFLISHGGVITGALTGSQKYWCPRLITRRPSITSTVIYYLVRSFVYLAYNSSINSSCISHVHCSKVRKMQKLLDNLYLWNFNCEILILLKYTCREKFRVYSTIFSMKKQGYCLLQRFTTKRFLQICLNSIIYETFLAQNFLRMWVHKCPHRNHLILNLFVVLLPHSKKDLNNKMICVYILISKNKALKLFYL